MKAFAALFKSPGVEADYPGYERQEIDYVDQYFLKPVGIMFPAPTQGDAGGFTIAAVLSEKEGGDLLCATPLSNPLSTKEGAKMAVILFVNLPEDLSEVARTTYHGVLLGEIKAEDIHPKIYESINDELAARGIPVIKCVRSGSAKWDVKMSDMRSLNEAVSGATH